ncbi:Dak1-domain-containing protein [Myriangium duriaei CBS 260.36]|uniref:Dak1-domain-containing protein n=1 Tax=Myriangium duriaei CBS 260.36 TaxID=1168546 RepID=A0A9P4J348_9PEZI|nr:Dak1-domain-containing protein [Myriangium duriaei CBS 260.36]
MSAKHFFADTPGVVVLSLESLVARNPHLALDHPNKVVYHKAHDPKKVVLISGGGAGHEPAWSGYVGHGMLGAAVSGEVFASPSAKQIMAAIKQVPSDAGIILCITNYTGDNLHFGLAREKTVGLGYKIGMLRMSEDVGLGREQTENTGRRGLAGNMFVLKICGAAAAQDYSFEDCMKIGHAVNDNCGTIGSSLDYCHIPGRKHHEQLGADVYSVAQGIHNEPGLKELSPIPPAEELISSLLKYLLDPSDSDRNYVSYASDPTTALLINNFGGMSNFEVEALTTITLRTLKAEWSIVPQRIFVQCFETSLNAPGWSISLLNLSGISNTTSIPVNTLTSLLDSDTTAPCWPRNGYAHSPSSTFNPSAAKASSSTSSNTGPSVPTARLSSALRTASEALLAAEPDITHWDTQVGDGDCGEATSSIARGVLSTLDSSLPTNSRSSDDSIPLYPVLDALSDAVEETGGSLAAILAIYLAGFTSALRTTVSSSATTLDTGSIASAARTALDNLQGYTRARVGGRTVMDALIPFSEGLQSGSAREAVKRAEEGARKTEGMAAKYGRASYVGSERMGEKGKVPMDPGAWAAVVFLKGLVEGWEGSG